MRSALYYPHTEIRSQELIKTALLLWDRLEYIVPSQDYQPRYQDRWSQAAIELIGIRHYPTEDEGRLTEAQIEDFVSRPLPSSFYYTQSGDNDEKFAIYPQKFSLRAWRILHDAQLAGSLPNDDRPIRQDYPLRQATGLSIMAILADVCAGETFQRVTDRGGAYAALAGLLRDSPSNENQVPQPSEEQLVPITLDLVNYSNVSLERLVKFREREEVTGGHALRDLRHRYLDRIETCVRTLTTLKGKRSDLDETKRQFQQDMADDLAILRDELRFTRNEALLSKEVLFTAVALVGTIASLVVGGPLALDGALTASGTVGTIGGLIIAKGKYASNRRSILEKHPTAYLYQLTSPLL